MLKNHLAVFAVLVSAVAMLLSATALSEASLIAEPEYVVAVTGDEFLEGSLADGKKCQGNRKYTGWLDILEVTRERGNIMVRYRTPQQWFYATSFTEVKCE